jgi:enoyl-CoA hydratase/carnithine racemase
LEEGFRFEDLLVKNLRKTEDAKEGLKAFAESRRIVFKGR